MDFLCFLHVFSFHTPSVIQPRKKLYFLLVHVDCYTVYQESHPFPYSDLLSLKRKKTIFFLSFLKCPRGFPGGSVGKNPPASAGRQQIWSLIQEDSTSCRATEPPSHTCWACALEPRGAAAEPACCSNWGPGALEPVLQSQTGHQDEKSAHHNSRGAPAHRN